MRDLMKSSHFGTLFIIATPLGNLQDMTLRAVQILQSVQVIAAEDTRHSLPLLQHFSIKTKTLSLHDFNERTRAYELIERLKQGDSIALISDAGTPLISDPGYLLVKEAHDAGVPVVPIPGPCAAIAALSASGLPTDRFVFEGFLPKQTKLRKKRLENLLNEDRTIIFYESPHRITTFLDELARIFGEDRFTVLARELTKKHETILLGTISELKQKLLSDSNQQRGEFVVLVSGSKPKEQTEITVSIEHLLTVFLKELPLKQAVDIALTLTGGKKNDLYEKALKINQSL